MPVFILPEHGCDLERSQLLGQPLVGFRRIAIDLAAVTHQVILLWIASRNILDAHNSGDDRGEGFNFCHSV